MKSAKESRSFTFDDSDSESEEEKEADTIPGLKTEINECSITIDNLKSKLLEDPTDENIRRQLNLHQKVIDLAKEKLSTTELTISEIAYELGFEHPQSFSKLFKQKTNQTALEFRQSFN